MDKMRIAYIAFYNLDRDTAATEHILRTVSGLCALGHKVKLIVPNFRNEIQLKDIEIVKISRRNSILFDIAAANWIRMYVRDYMGAFHLPRRLKNLGMPFVLEHNGLMHAEIPIHGGFRWWALFEYDNHFALRRRLRDAHINIVVTSAIGDFLAKRYGLDRSKFIHVPNGADISRFVPANDKHQLRRKKGLLPEDAFWIGYIGAMFPWHMLDRLILAFEMLAEKRKDVRLFIAGDGPERVKIFSMARKSPSNGMIVTKCPLSLSESHEYTAAMDIGMALMDRRVAPYCWQVKVNHNGACGVPSIITYDPQYEELFKLGVAFPVVDCAPESIFVAIEHLLDRQKLLEIGQKARKYVAENLSWDNVNLTIEKTIMSICRR